MTTSTLAPEHTTTPRPRPAGTTEQVDTWRPSRAFLAATLDDDWDKMHPAVREEAGLPPRP